MKLVASRDDLSTALDKVELALSSKIDTYRQILLELTLDGWAIFTGTNGTLTIKTAFAAESEDEAGDFKILLPPDTAKAVRTLPDGEITMTSNKTGIEIRSEHGPKFKLRYGDASAYPVISFRKKVDFKLPLDWFMQIIGYLGAISKAELVLFENGTANGQIVTTDGFRIGVIDSGVVFEFDEPVVIPATIFRHVEKVLTGSGDVEVIVETNRVTFRQGKSAISTLRSSKKFSSWKSLMETDSKADYWTFSTDKIELLRACDRAQVLTGIALPMKLKLEPETKGADISASRSDIGESEEHISGRWPGLPLTIGLNVDLFRPVIQSLTGDEVDLWFAEPKAMFRISSPKDPSVRFIMMPVRLPE
jgi:DNA polymerase III sliding clamp (beta) subunit (PCNA family)